MSDPQPTMKFTWEQMLEAFAGEGHTTVVHRTDVTGTPWITGRELATDTQDNNNQRKKKDGRAGGNSGYDLWAEWTYAAAGSVTYTTILGITLNWPFWDDKAGNQSGSVLHRFHTDPGDVLGPSIWNGGPGNENTSPKSLVDAGDKLAQVEKAVGELRSRIQAFADRVDGAGSDFQGSAAGRFKEVLIGLKNEVRELHYRLNGTVASWRDDAEGATPPAVGSSIAEKLKKAGEQLLLAQQNMYNLGYNPWRGVAVRETKTSDWNYKDYAEDIARAPSDEHNNSWAWPYACVRDAFQREVEKITTVVLDTTKHQADVGGAGYVLSSKESGPIASAVQSFTDNVNTKATEIWTGHVVQVLDAAATAAGNLVMGAYQAAGDMLHQFGNPSMNLPKDKVDPPKGAPDSNGPGGGGAGGKGGGGTGGPPPPTTIKGGPGGIGGGDGKGAGGKGAGGIGGIGGIGGVGGTNGQVPLLGKDGKPLLDKDGKPMYVPAGTTVNSKGELIGKDGKPLLDKDGKPRHVPLGTVVGQPSTGGGTSGNTGNTGSSAPFKVPVGSKKNEDGTVTGPDGNLLKDANGYPVVLGKDRTIDTDGTVRDANGRPVSQFEQLLTDAEHAYAGGSGSIGTGGRGSGGTIGLPGSFGGGGDFSFGSGGSGGVGSTKGGTDLFGEPYAGKNGISAKTVGGLAASGPPTVGVGGRLADALGVKPTAQAAAEEAAAARAAAGRAGAAAAEESQLMGRGIPTTGGMGGPMMPPMGAGAGAGAGAGQGEKERQRTTWLSEDEEVWGTDAGGVTGVIGR
ncbi:hypothetical protein ACIRD3_07090 [Kitasatospora sp. NPDC093550]|uniref:hypothetical protein n=1 Tax=Kitasatospora sp. NPDC093550 TaxID=3364089 RepID=UPI003823AD08